MANKQIVLAAGGTGGHLIPAQALARELLADFDVTFAASGLAQNPYFERAEFDYVDFASSTLTLSKPLYSLRGLFRLFGGVREAGSFLRRVKPKLVVGFGSFHSFPILQAAKMAGIPFILHEGNGIPGRVIRFFSKTALLTGVAIPSAAASLKGRVETVPLPLRDGFNKVRLSKEQARLSFGLRSELRTLLVFGGSQGASALNQLVSSALREVGGWQVLHITGKDPQMEKIAESYARAGICAYVAPFEEEMWRGWQAADLAITRSGASSIAEQVAMEVPAILVPFPYATDAHQDHNAAWVQKLGGGVFIRQADLTTDRLVQYLKDWDLAYIQNMREALRAHKQGHPRSLASYIKEAVT